VKQDTKWRLRDTEGKEYIIIDSEKVDMQEELNKTITKQMKEIERLNNIFNELEKWVEEKFKIENTQYYYVIDANDLKRKIKELKGSEKE